MQQKLALCPEPNETWRHYKGGSYRIIGVGRIEATMELVVIYVSAVGQIWVRPLVNFMEDVVTEKGIEPRFWKES